jgi:hypothetical protein
VYQSKERESEVMNLLCIIGGYLKSRPRDNANLQQAFNSLLKDIELPSDGSQVGTASVAEYLPLSLGPSEATPMLTFEPSDPDIDGFSAAFAEKLPAVEYDID